ncbi:MAG: sulfurtransferase [Ginsengibacter sp.]
MAETLYPIIKPSELTGLDKNDNLVLIDARSGNDALEKYLQAHLNGALFVDLEKDLADIKTDVAQGGRHPLPGLREFARFIGTLGIDKISHVIVYDDKNGANAAARFWWMVRAIGHKKVQVLDGGYEAAKEAGFPITAGEEKVQQKEAYEVSEWLLPTATMDEAGTAAADNNSAVVDVREEKRYDGIYEPIDLIAGHIPGAINIPFTDNLDENGRFLSPEKLKSKYVELPGGIGSAKTIVHCGSGVTACHTILAMDAAGLPIPTLYTGSWSEWSRNNKPVATTKAN